ncbi:MAG: DnaJ domain-containing protein [Hyalangium sp.]|uniref:DnaJ domain-containing protein n=1 Tax=Hyalangium sp. TaxID=2028555 RepID=UPI00389A53F7
MKDPYEVLGVSQTTDPREIRRAYLKLVQQYHPDRDARAESAARFLEIQEAYECLSDPVRRQALDARSRAAQEPAKGPGGGSEPSRTARERHWDRSRFSQEQSRAMYGHRRVTVKIR